MNPSVLASSSRGTPAKALQPDGTWTYYLGIVVVDRAAYKQAVTVIEYNALKRIAESTEPSVESAAEAPSQPTAVDKDAPHIKMWKSGDASFWFGSRRVQLEEFLAYFAPMYVPDRPVTIGGTDFSITRVSPKYSIYSVSGTAMKKADFIARLVTATGVPTTYPPMDVAAAK